MAIIDKPAGDKNHGFESCQSSEQIASSPVVGFGDYQGEICDLLLAINVVRLALEAEEDNRAQSGTVRIALDHLEDMATELKTKWHEDYASLREPS